LELLERYGKVHLHKDVGNSRKHCSLIREQSDDKELGTHSYSMGIKHLQISDIGHSEKAPLTGLEL